MTDDSLPEPDRVEGAPHPRETAKLFGQATAEATFLAAYATGRLHHGWLLSGPRGVGKATLAWRIARFLLATPPQDAGGLFGGPPAPPETLDVPDSHPVARRMRAGAEPGLFLLRRGPNDKGDRLSADIRVDEVRRLKGFLHLSAADGGRRVVIVDAADDLNSAAANALLKLLEEPPEGATLLLISHQPAGLLPTIRSRCRDLRLAPLSPGDLDQALTQAGTVAADSAALSVLSGGSAGEAIRLANLDGLALYTRLVALFATLPRLDRTQALTLADLAAQRGPAAEGRLDLILTLMDLFLSRLARAGILGQPGPEAAPGEAALLARLSPHDRAARDWADLHQTLGARARHGRAVNLDPAALVLDMILRMDQAAGQLAR
jgi:DNA polymerase-3 subunit delta'